MWACLKKILPTKTNNTSDEIEFEQKTTTDTKDICNKFNDYFIDSILKINAEIPLQYEQLLTEPEEPGLRNCSWL